MPAVAISSRSQGKDWIAEPESYKAGRENLRAYIFQAKDQLSGLGYPFDSDYSARSSDVSQLVFSRE